MISIRTALVLAAFVAMALTSVAERFAHRTQAEPELTETISVGETMPDKVLRLTEKSPANPEAVDLSPWI